MSDWTGMGPNAPAPKLDPNCQCICHSQPGVMHVAACCSAPPMTAARDDLARALADALGAGEALQRDVHSLVAAICDSWDERDRLAAELDAAQTQLGNWIVRADEANVRAEKAEAELAAAAELAAVEAMWGEARESAMQALASMGQAQEAYEAQLKTEAELAAAQQREVGLREALTLIERVYYLEEKDVAWKIARMNGIAREAQDGNDLAHYRRIFPRYALAQNGRKGK